MTIPYSGRESESSSHSFIPEMAKEVFFWCAVFVVAVTGAILVGQMGSGWSARLSPAEHATVSPQSPKAAPAEVETERDAAMALIRKEAVPNGQEATTF